MTYSIKSVAASRPEASPRVFVESSIPAMLASSKPPSDATIAALLTRDNIEHTFAILQPGNLSEILCYSLQGLLPYRLARFFGAIEIGCVGFDAAQLKRLRTPEGRLAQAACGLLAWKGASTEERRIIIVRLVLLMRWSS